jgi:hypothetical protein
MKRPIYVASTGSARRVSTDGKPTGGLEVSEAKRLKGLESENAKLKRLLADAMLDKAALKGGHTQSQVTAGCVRVVVTIKPD